MVETAEQAFCSEGESVFRALRSASKTTVVVPSRDDAERFVGPRDLGLEAGGYPASF